MRLENWSLHKTTDPTPHLNPGEAKPLDLVFKGEVYDDPRGRADGKGISTSYVVRVDDANVLHTFSGSQYQLGEPAAYYEKYCAKNGIDLYTVETKDLLNIPIAAIVPDWLLIHIEYEAKGNPT